MVSRIIAPEASVRGAPGSIYTFPAPVGGLNTRDSVMAIGAQEARVLVNWLPDDGKCTVRPGYAAFGSSISGSKPVKQLARFANGSTTKLIATSNGTVQEVSSGTPSSIGTGYTNDYWSVDYINGHLFGVNGVDAPWDYNGSSLSNASFTGPSLTALRTVKSVQNRLWFTNGTGDVYYGPLEGVAGPLTLFALSQIADGGKCIAVFPWRTYTVFFYDTGQVLAYQGDPQALLGSGSDFTEVSKYYAPPLIEPDACVKMGGELIAMTKSGPISMDVIASGNAFNLAALGTWSKINPSWKNDFATYGANLGWFGKFINGLMYFNVATGTATTKQYVYNTRNQAWTTYQNLPLSSLEYFNGNVYFGSSGTDGAIWQHTGGLDNGTQIFTQARPGFSHFDIPQRKKLITLIKPNIFTAYLLNVQAQIDADFMSSPFNAYLSNMSAAGTTTPWGSPWGSPWASQPKNFPKFLGAGAQGYYLSAILQGLSSGADVEWFATDVVYQEIGVLS
jgi:hypothetical protein